MKNVPSIISSKDLSYIDDMLNWNYILIKKINNYLKVVKDKDLNKMLTNNLNVLINNYSSLLNVLDKEVNG